MFLPIELIPSKLCALSLARFLPFEVSVMELAEKTQSEAFKKHLRMVLSTARQSKGADPDVWAGLDQRSGV